MEKTGAWKLAGSNGGGRGAQTEGEKRKGGEVTCRIISPWIRHFRSFVSLFLFFVRATVADVSSVALCSLPCTFPDRAE